MQEEDRLVNLSKSRAKVEGQNDVGRSLEKALS